MNLLNFLKLIFTYDLEKNNFKKDIFRTKPKKKFFNKIHNYYISFTYNLLTYNLFTYNIKKFTEDLKELIIINWYQKNFNNLIIIISWK